MTPGTSLASDLSSYGVARSTIQGSPLSDEEGRKTHGENKARKVFGDLIQSRFGLKTEQPSIGDVIEI